MFANKLMVSRRAVTMRPPIHAGEDRPDA
jgi:hypothetical protein